jgi:hypothetical protein
VLEHNSAGLALCFDEKALVDFQSLRSNSRKELSSSSYYFFQLKGEVQWEGEEGELIESLVLFQARRCCRWSGRQRRRGMVSVRHPDIPSLLSGSRPHTRNRTHLPLRFGSGFRPSM